MAATRVAGLFAGASLLLLAGVLLMERISHPTAMLGYPAAKPVLFAHGNQYAMYQGVRPRLSLYAPLQVLVCDPEDPHCGYGGVDNSPQAYADPSPLAIIGEKCTEENAWDCPYPGPANYGPDSPAIWLPEEDAGDGLVRKVWPDWPESRESDAAARSGIQVLSIHPRGW